MLHCPSCTRELTADHIKSGTEVCPHCKSSLVPAHLRNKALLNPQVLNTATMRPFEHIDPDLYDRIRAIEPVHSWPLAVLAEIVDFEYGRLSFAMNHAPEMRAGFISFSRKVTIRRRIMKRFEHFVQGLAEVQDVLSKDLHAAIVASDMKELWVFCDHLSDCTDWLITFHAEVAGLRHLEDSMPQKIQLLMLDWIQHILICFERLAKQLRRKCGLDRHQVQAHSIQMSLAPNSLNTFFTYLNHLRG